MLHEGEKTLDNWLEWQQSLNLNEIDLSLDRINAVKEKVGFQQPDIDIFLVAGTNGKGSILSYIRTILQENKFLVHCYISPHLESITERFIISNNQIGKRKLLNTY